LTCVFCESSFVVHQNPGFEETQSVKIICAHAPLLAKSHPDL
jgi:hypothetical protein